MYEMINFDELHYVPLLKGKQGEFLSLRKIPNELRRKFIPLIDIPKVGWDFEKNEKKKPLHKHLEKMAKEIINSWEFNKPIFIDLFDIELSERIHDGSHPLNFIFNKLHDRSVYSIPTTGLDRDSDYNKAVRKIINKDKRGVCIRIQEDDIIHKTKINQKLDSLLKYLKTNKKNSHLLFDYRCIRADDLSRILLNIKKRSIICLMFTNV